MKLVILDCFWFFDSGDRVKIYYISRLCWEFDFSEYCKYNWLYIFTTEVTSMIKIFDLDGTLIDSVPDLATALNKMLRDLGREAVREEDVRNWVGDGSFVP